MKSTVISKFLNQTKSHVSIVIVQTFLFNPVITIAQIVFLVWVMFLVITINLSMDDFNFEKDPFTRESIAIRTRLKK